uniref:Uncharacterized protein n=1 Tax=Vitis vinifera TaxID=29760 RepID=F6HDH5_VITVI
MGNHVNAVKLDFSKILPEDTKTELKEAAVISMGTELEAWLGNLEGRELGHSVGSIKGKSKIEM